MRLRNIRGSKDVIASCPFVVQEPESCRGRWAEIFGNENPILIEVGMGTAPRRSETGEARG